MPSRTHDHVDRTGRRPAGLSRRRTAAPGRRFTWWSSSNRSRSSSPRSRTPGGTLGSPTAPSRIASCRRSSSSDRVGQQLAGRAASARRRGRTSVVSTSGATSPQDLEALRHHLGTDAVPGDHRQPHGLANPSVRTRVRGPAAHRCRSARADRRADRDADPDSSSAGTALSTVTAISASPPRRGAADLRAGDVHAGLAERGADRADHAGAVGVAEEQQVARQVAGRCRSRRPRSASAPASCRTACRRRVTVLAVGQAPRTVTRLR